MGAPPKPQLQVVRTEASDLPTQPQKVPREIGNLQVPGEIFQVIDKALPEGTQLGEDSVTLSGPLEIQFNRIVKGTQYVALLYFDAGYPELSEQSWFLASVCLHIFTRAS